MSWSFQLQKINQSFERIAGWYHDFLERTEDAFQALSLRILRLEERQVIGPSDEQVERVLRKILAERFAHDEFHRTDSIQMIKDNDFSLEDAKSRSTIRPIRIDAASLCVEPESVPSKAYAETFQMLEGRLTEFPCISGEEPAEDMGGRIKVEYERSIL
ncbi:uncharacterized protein M421DRAFT_88280 [Didymella exigua CBS 183.55]|uniref:Uncharacterized protein n=1 Tax=Didymella exigua CBS 183.55 TaxID=1150837 RepID=A0A6A5S9Z3_9PLEO|nr:uncharacterized protein M421DRAFT_88280 [Didymella exigua CBS 183.55]KAF1934287.1 hypothetical protein M421DRAFT_88280 [Didymella exigua CBS 183.55]